MQDKVADYEKVLRELSTRVSEADADMIRTTLDRVGLLLLYASQLAEQVLITLGRSTRHRRSRYR